MTIVLSYGGGVESSAILARWLLFPSTRSFDLNDLVVISAQTGDEFPDTADLVETHLMPLMRRHQVRYVQVARRGNLAESGYVVLDDTREPKWFFRKGAYKLSDELLAAGTVPSVASRQCSCKSKGRPIDAWVADNIAGYYRHVIGFNSEEVKRVDRDQCYGGDNRNAEYPLVEWGWPRSRCEAFLKMAFGVDWAKSACVQCPFARGKSEVLDRFARFPLEATEALFIEHMSLALNPAMTLYSDRSLRSLLEKDGRHATALTLHAKRVEESDWNVYRVRRIYHAKGRADRSVAHMLRGVKKQTAVAYLEDQSAAVGIQPEYLSYSWRAKIRERAPNVYPSQDEMWVAAPMEVEEKEKKGFKTKWSLLTTDMSEKAQRV